TLEESKWRITAIAYLPLHAVLAVFPFTAFAGNVRKYARAVKRQSERLRRNQNLCSHANTNGMGEEPDGSRCAVTWARQLMATSKRLFEYAQKCLSDQDKGVAFWQLLGLQCPAVDELTTLVKALSPPQCPDPIRHLCLVHKHVQAQSTLGHLIRDLCSRRCAQLRDYKARVIVLRRLGYLKWRIGGPAQLTRKGLAALEIDQREVLLCEALCHGLLNHRTPAEAAAVLSCFVCDSQCERSRPFVSGRLQSVVARMLDLASELKYSSAWTGVDNSDIDFHVNPGLVEATYAWARGEALSVVADKSGADEGHLLRAFKRLGEVLQQARKACHHLGYQTLETLMLDAHVAINRGALTMSSLYISHDI
uniref:DSHCT domain-containing protein n=1 Tax=Mesocestoides corti TaxID=53468 RepID=A0A5K3FZX9_MESCO